jgi:prophage tail gpP-like protein
MAFERVTVVADDQSYEGWKSVTITAGINQATRDFTLVVTEPNPEGIPSSNNWPLLPNTEVSIFATGDLLVAGYVDEYRPVADSRTHSVTVTGRGHGADYVDSSLVHPTGRFENKTVLEIAQELDVFGVGISSDFPVGPPIPWFQTRKGATPWQEVMRLLPQTKLTMMGTAEGGIKLTKAGAIQQVGGLIQGKNILSLAGSLTSWNLYSEQMFTFQSSIGTKDYNIEGVAQAHDNSVPRLRVNNFTELAEANMARAQARATYNAYRAAGLSKTANIVTPGWRDDSNKFWEPPNRTHVYSTFLKLDQEMVIEHVEWKQDSKGTVTTLLLVDPVTYDGDASAANASGSEWNIENAIGEGPSKHMKEDRR